MAEVKSNPVIYKCDAEGRDAFWSSLRNSFNRKAIALDKTSRPEQVFCDSSQYEYQCNDVENKYRNDSEERPQTPQTPQTPVTGEEQSSSCYSTTTTTTPTTPPPPPPLQSPPPLEHRSAGQRRRRSSACADGWPVELTASAAGVGVTRSRSAVYRLKSRASAISAITWLDDVASAAAAEDPRPCKSCNNNDSDYDGCYDGEENDGRDGGAESAATAAVGRTAAAEEDEREGRRAAGDGDWSAARADDGQAVMAARTEESPARSVVYFDVNDDDDDGGGGGGGEDEDVDDPTLVNYDEDRDRRIYGDSAGVNKVYNDVVGDSPAAMSDRRPISEYEMKLKEIDENIAFYSKRFVCTVMFFVLLRVFY